MTLSKYGHTRPVRGISGDAARAAFPAASPSRHLRAWIMETAARNRPRQDRLFAAFRSLANSARGLRTLEFDEAHLRSSREHALHNLKIGRNRNFSPDPLAESDLKAMRSMP